MFLSRWVPWRFEIEKFLYGSIVGAAIVSDVSVPNSQYLKMVWEII